MNKNNLKTVLTHIKEFVKNSRPAYKDYLGEETVTTPGKTLMTGTLAAEGELTLVDTSFTGFVAGKTYQVTVGDVTGEYVGQQAEGVMVLSFDFASAVESQVMPTDYWAVVVSDGQAICLTVGTYIGQTITVSTLPTTTVEKKYDVKKLSEDLLPDKTVKDISNLKSRFNSHASDTTRHITSDDRNAWDNAYNHSQQSHAPTNAEKNQNAFSYVKVGSTSISADSSTDTLTLAAGNNITLTPDSSNDKVTFSVANASTSSKGVVQLSSSTSSTSTTTAATSSSVKSAYDLAAEKVTMSDLDIGVECLEALATKESAFTYNGKQFYKVGTVADSISTMANNNNRSLVVRIGVSVGSGGALAFVSVPISGMSTYGSQGSPYYVCYFTNIGTTTTAISNKTETVSVQLAFSNDSARSILAYCSGSLGWSKVTSIQLMQDIKTVISTHDHNDSYYTKTEIDTKLEDTASLDAAKTYSDTGDATTLTSAKTYSDTGDATTLTSAKTYTDEQLAGLSQIQFITWEGQD